MKEVSINSGNTYLIPVGKYKGLNIVDVYEDDTKYFEWMYESLNLQKAYPLFFCVLENLICTGNPF